MRLAPPSVGAGPTVSRDVVRGLEREMDETAAAIPALRRFHTLLETLPAEAVAARLAPVWAELCYNLESFNPVFTAVMLKVQCTIGQSDYVRRDEALQCLIVPLAGEYGLAPEYKLGACAASGLVCAWRSVLVERARRPPSAAVRQQR